MRSLLDASEQQGLFQSLRLPGADEVFNTEIDPQHEYRNPILAGFYPSLFFDEDGKAHIGRTTVLPPTEVDGRHLSTLSAGGFTGAMVGLYTALSL